MHTKRPPYEMLGHYTKAIGINPDPYHRRRAKVRQIKQREALDREYARTRTLADLLERRLRYAT